MDEKKPQWGEVGHEVYVLIVEYPYGWRSDSVMYYETEDELNDNVEFWKAKSGDRRTEEYIRIRIGVATTVN